MILSPLEAYHSSVVLNAKAIRLVIQVFFWTLKHTKTMYKCHKM